MNGVRTAYAIIGRVGAGAAGAAARLPGNGKLLRSIRGRRGLDDRIAGWSASTRDDRRPLLWVHAPSVGEGLQARPVLDELRRRRPDLQVAYTYFSSSAELFGRTLVTTGLVDFADYLPWDTRPALDRALASLRPRVLAFSKLDVWPILAQEAGRRGVALALMSATLQPGSGRRGTLASSLLRPAYAALDRVGAVGRADADRLLGLGVRTAAMRVTGDTRYDQVWTRAHTTDRESPWLAPLVAGDRPIVLAGSTWPGDEAVLAAAWTAVRKRHPGLRLVLAPHEPTEAHVRPLESWAEQEALSVARLGRDPSSDDRVSGADVVLIDRVGILGDLYAAAQIAFVGGGFHAAGLHSVIEPAAFGVPVLFGPRHQGSRDAAGLLDAAAAIAVSDPASLSRAVDHWLSDPGARRAAGDRAREVVRNGLGATARTVEMLEELLARP